MPSNNNDLYQALKNMGYTDQFNQSLKKFLGDSGYTQALNEAMYHWLGSQGYTGAYPERISQWAANNYTTSGDVTSPLITSSVFDEINSEIDLVFTEANFPVIVYWQIRAIATAIPSQTAMINNTGGLLGGTYNVDSGTDSEPVDITSLSNGDYTLYILLKDPSNNYSNIEDYDFTKSGVDTTAPILSSPTDTSNGSTASTGSVTTDEGNGTLYWVVTTSSTPPSAAQVKAGQDNSGVSATASGSQVVNSAGTLNISASGLTAVTSYTTHYMHEDSATNQSTVSSASGFTTSAASSGITVKSVTAFKEDGDAALTVKDISLPTYAENDTIVFVMGSDQAIGNGSAGIADFANYLDDGHTWNVLENNSGAANPGIMVAYKRMGPPPVLPDPPETIPLRPGNTKGVEGVFLVVSGGHATNIIDNSHSVSTGATGLPDPASHTTVTNDALRVVVAVLDDDIAALSGGPTGWDNITPGPGDGNATASVLMATKAAPTAGAEDPSILTGTGDDEWMAVHFALRAE